MRILAVSDVESPYYYDHYAEGKLSGFDLIIACGDLREGYLEFLISMANCPLVYVHGNHDDFKRNPDGCVCIDDDIFVINGMRILGLGGSYRYKNGKYMYTERQMKLRVFKLIPKLIRRKGFDILVTHAPARHLNDFDTLTHRGFECFNQLIDKYKPKYFLHGHIHRNYGSFIPQKTEHGETTVINACGHCIIEI